MAQDPRQAGVRADAKSPRVSGGLGFNVAATYFSTCVPGSIIGPLELNCRVRDGNGCGLQGIATTKGYEIVEG